MIKKIFFIIIFSIVFIEAPIVIAKTTKINGKLYKGPFIINTEVMKEHAKLYSSWEKMQDIEKDILGIGMDRFKYIRKRGPMRFRFQSLY